MATSNKNVNINIKTKGGKNAEKTFSKVEGSIKSVAMSAVRAGAAFFGGRAILQGMSTAVRMSAEMEGVKRGFDNLAKSTGFSANAFDNFNEATDGTMDAMELMQQANNAMLLGITDNEEQMAEMFDTAQRLAEAVGKDTAFGVESLVTGLGRQSKMMLDNLGIMFDVEKANEEYAKSIGKTTKNLTDQERKTAFTNKALEEAKRLVSNLGEEVPTTNRSLLSMSSAFGDLAITLGDKLGPSVISSSGLLTNFARNLNKSIKTINFTETFKNLLKNTEALTIALRKTFSAYLDYLPDYWKSIFTKFNEIGLAVFTKFIELIKEVAAIAFEPLVVAISHVGQKIKQGFVTIINGLLGGVNLLIEKVNLVGTKLGFDEIKEVNLLDVVKVDPLLDKLKETKIGQFIVPSENDIQTLSEFTGVTTDIWAEYFEAIKVKNEETTQAGVDANKKANETIIEDNLNRIKLLTKEELTKMKKETDAGMNLANKLFNFQKQKRDQELNEEIQNVLKSKMTEEQKEAAIANLKEQFRQKDIEAKKKMKHISIIEAIINTAVAVTEVIANPVLASLVAAAGAVEVATIRAQEFNKGGIVKGVGNLDTVPAMLTPGELILNQAQQNNLAGGMGGVTVNIGGNIIGEESFVRDTLIPEIERARTLA